MAKLHELLAADSTAKAQSDKCRSDLLNTFEKKRHLFGEKNVTFQPSEEGALAVTEDQSDLQTTVRSELKWLAEIWARSLDVDYQIAESNMEARADVVMDDGSTLLRDVPATALLELEKRAGEMHALVSAIPTLDPAKGFRLDADKGAGIYRSREVNKTRTKKMQKPLVLYPATPEHPAQTQLITEDVSIGTIREQEWSGLLTPADKADMLSRAEALRRALKQARSRANEAAAVGDRVGDLLLAYVFGTK